MIDPHAASPLTAVMKTGCAQRWAAIGFTAGTAGNDTGAITSQEAQRRVAEYADPFFDRGAGGYYANWFGDGFAFYIQSLFAGKTLGQAYEAYTDFNPQTVERYGHPAHRGMAMWLDKDNWNGTKYNNAFVGKADRTLTDLFSLRARERPFKVFLPLAVR